MGVHRERNTVTQMNHGLEQQQTVRLSESETGNKRKIKNRK